MITINTCEIEHLLKLLPGHECVSVQERISADLSGEFLHLSHGRNGVESGRDYKDRLILPDLL